MSCTLLARAQRPALQTSVQSRISAGPGSSPPSLSPTSPAVSLWKEPRSSFSFVKHLLFILSPVLGAGGSSHWGLRGTLLGDATWCGSLRWGHPVVGRRGLDWMCLAQQQAESPRWRLGCVTKAPLGLCPWGTPGSLRAGSSCPTRGGWAVRSWRLGSLVAGKSPSARWGWGGGHCPLEGAEAPSWAALAAPRPRAEKRPLPGTPGVSRGRQSPARLGGVTCES